MIGDQAKVLLHASHVSSSAVRRSASGGGMSWCMRRSFKHVSDDLWDTQPESPTAERFNFGLNSITDAAAAVRSDKGLGVGSPYIRQHSG